MKECRDRHSQLFKTIATGMICLFLANQVAFAYPDALAVKAGEPETYKEMLTEMVNRRYADHNEGEETPDVTKQDGFIRYHWDNNRIFTLSGEIESGSDYAYQRQEMWEACVKAFELSSATDIWNKLAELEWQDEEGNAGRGIAVQLLIAERGIELPPSLDGKGRMRAHASSPRITVIVTEKELESGKVALEDGTKIPINNFVRGILFHEIRARSSTARMLYERELQGRPFLSQDQARRRYIDVLGEYEEISNAIQHEVKEYGYIRTPALVHEFARLDFDKKLARRLRDYEADENVEELIFPVLAKIQGELGLASIPQDALEKISAALLEVLRDPQDGGAVIYAAFDISDALGLGDPNRAKPWVVDFAHSCQDARYAIGSVMDVEAPEPTPAREAPEGISLPATTDVRQASIILGQRSYPHPKLRDDRNADIHVSCERNESGSLTVRLASGTEGIDVLDVVPSDGGIELISTVKREGEDEDEDELPDRFTLPTTGIIESVDLFSVEEHHGLISFELRITTQEERGGLHIRNTYGWVCISGMFREDDFTVNVFLNPENLTTSSEEFRTYDDAAIAATTEASDIEAILAPEREIGTALMPVEGREGMGLIQRSLARPELGQAILADLSLLAYFTSRGILIPHSNISIDITDEPPTDILNLPERDRFMYTLLHSWQVDVDREEVRFGQAIGAPKRGASFRRPVRFAESFVPYQTRLADLEIIHPRSKKVVPLCRFIAEISKEELRFSSWLTEDYVRRRLEDYEFGFALYGDTLTGLLDLSFSLRDIAIGIQPEGVAALAIGATRTPVRPSSWTNIQLIASGHSHGIVPEAAEDVEGLRISQTDVVSLLDDIVNKGLVIPHILLEVPSEESQEAIVNVYKLSPEGEELAVAQLPRDVALDVRQFELVAKAIHGDMNRYMVHNTYRLPLPAGAVVRQGRLVALPHPPAEGGQLIGNYARTSGIEFIEDESDPDWDGYVRFMGYDIRDPGNYPIEIRIKAKRIPEDEEVFENYDRGILPEMDDKLSRALAGIDKKNRFELDATNRYGIYGMGTPHLLGIARPLKNYGVALWHEVAHAAAIMAMEIIPYIEGGRTRLDEFLDAGGDVPDSDRAELDVNYRRKAQDHYAYILLQMQRRLGDNAKLKKAISFLEQERLIGRKKKTSYIQWIAPVGPYVKGKLRGLYERCFDAQFPEGQFEGYGKSREYMPWFAWSEDGDLLGFAAVQLLPKGMNIVEFFVDPEFRRMGVGQAMVNRLIRGLSSRRVIGRNYLWVEISKGNTEARQFFKEMGFRELSVEEHPKDITVAGNASLLEYEYRPFPVEEAEEAFGGGPAMCEYVPLSDPQVEFHETAPGAGRGYIGFDAYHIKDPERKKIRIKINAKKAGEHAGKFDEYQKTRVDEIDNRLSSALGQIGEGQRFLLERNPYGVNYIGLPGLLAISEDLVDDGLAKTYALINAAGVSAEDIISHVDDGKEELAAWMSMEDIDYREEYRAHYALFLLAWQWQGHPWQHQVLHNKLKLLAGAEKYYKDYLAESMPFVKEFLPAEGKAKCLRVPIETLQQDDDKGALKYIQELQKKGIIIELYSARGTEISADICAELGLERQTRPEGEISVTLALREHFTKIDSDADFRNATGGLIQSETIIVPISLREPATLVRGSLFGFRLLHMAISKEVPDAEFLRDTIWCHRSLIRGISPEIRFTLTTEILLEMVQALKDGDVQGIAKFIRYLLDEMPQPEDFPLDIEQRIYEHATFEVSA